MPLVICLSFWLIVMRIVCSQRLISLHHRPTRTGETRSRSAAGTRGCERQTATNRAKIERYPQPYACHFVCTLHEDSQFSKIIVASPDENHAGKRASSGIHLLLEGGVGNDEATVGLAEMNVTHLTVSHEASPRDCWRRHAPLAYLSASRDYSLCGAAGRYGDSL